MPLKYFSFPDDRKLPLSSVIISIYDGIRYDDLYSQYKQVSPTGMRTSVYIVTYKYLSTMLVELQHGTNNHPVYTKFVEDVTTADKSSVIFNFECCGSCQNKTFPKMSDTYNIIEYAISNGHMLYFSDFSAKCLLRQWNDSILGPKCFVQLNEFGGEFDLSFSSEKLSHCTESNQLQMIGCLCDNDRLTLKALDQTIIFTTIRVSSHNKYTLDILTVVSKHNDKLSTEQFSDVDLPEINGTKGTVGHALLKYPTGAMIMLSAGHWIELHNFNPNLQALEKIIHNGNYDDNLISSFQSDLDASIGDPQSLMIMSQGYARNIIFSSNPGRSAEPGRSN